MAIGRPIELTPNIATKNISAVATADQTEFTVTGGYRINEIAVYRNGVRLAEGRDFTASDGDTVNLVTGATVSDVIEFAVFDSFNVSDAIVSAASSQSLNGDFNVTGNLYAGTFNPTELIAGIATVNTALHVGSALTTNAAGDVETIGIITAATFKGDGSGLTGIGETVNVRTNTITVSGVSTFTGVSNFSAAVNVDATTDSTSSTTGALIVDGGLGVAKNVYIGAGLSVAGTLTYEDVTNVDSVGLITAKSGVNVSGGQVTIGTGITMGIAGVATFSGTSDIHLLDNVELQCGDAVDFKIYHDSAGSNRIESKNSHTMYIAGDQTQITNAAISEACAKFIADGAVELYYDNAKKFETTNDGVVITGLTTCDGLRMGDDERIKIGNSEDLQIYHHSSHDSYVSNGTGFLALRSTEDVRLTSSGNDLMVKAIVDGAVEVYYDNSKKLATTNEGIEVTGFTSTTAGLGVTGGLFEGAFIKAGKLTDNLQIGIATANVFYFTTAETTTGTPNIRWNDTYSLSSKMAVGDVASVTVITTAAAAGYCANWTIDGNAVTEEWVGGSAPSAGGADGLDIYSFTIIKTGTGTGDSGFKVIGNVSNAT